MTTSTSLNIFYDFIEASERSSAAVRREPPVGLGVSAYLLSALSLFLAEAIAGRPGVLGPTLVGLSAVAVWSLGCGILQTALVHIVSEASGGKGKVLPMFVLLGLSELAWSLVLPGVLVAQAFCAGSVWSYRAVFAVVGLITILLKIRSVRQNYRVGALSACFALLFPYVALAGGIFFIFFAAIWGAIQQFAQMLT